MIIKIVIVVSSLAVYGGLALQSSIGHMDTKVLLVSLVLINFAALSLSGKKMRKCAKSDADAAKKQLKHSNDKPVLWVWAFGGNMFCLFGIQDKKSRYDHKSNCEEAGGVLAHLTLQYLRTIYKTEDWNWFLKENRSYYYSAYKVQNKWQWALDGGGSTKIELKGDALYYDNGTKTELVLNAESVEYIKINKDKAIQPERRHLVLYVNQNKQWALKLTQHNAVHGAMCQLFVYEDERKSSTTEPSSAPQTDRTPATPADESQTATTSLHATDHVTNATKRAPVPEGVDQPEPPKKTEDPFAYLPIVAPIFGVLFLIAVTIMILLCLQTNKLKRALAETKSESCALPMKQGLEEGTQTPSSCYNYDQALPAPADQHNKEKSAVSSAPPSTSSQFVTPGLNAETAKISKASSSTVTPSNYRPPSPTAAPVPAQSTNELFLSALTHTTPASGGVLQ